MVQWSTITFLFLSPPKASSPPLPFNHSAFLIFIAVNNCKAAYDATVHLINEGYKKIACLANAEHLSITEERIKGYKQALQKNNMAVDETLIKICEHGGLVLEETEKAVDELMHLNPMPDAIVGLNDKLTTGCLKILQLKKIKIPGDIALVGFTNSDLSELLNPSLTIIRQPAFEMGELATGLLIQQIESKRLTREFSKKILETELVVRDSSRRTI
jgi:DNA-binding LacI/PurR family transcriptional regulator